MLSKQQQATNNRKSKNREGAILFPLKVHGTEASSLYPCNHILSFGKEMTHCLPDSRVLFVCLFPYLLIWLLSHQWTSQCSFQLTSIIFKRTLLKIKLPNTPPPSHCESAGGNEVTAPVFTWSPHKHWKLLNTLNREHSSRASLKVY